MLDGHTWPTNGAATRSLRSPTTRTARAKSAVARFEGGAHRAGHEPDENGKPGDICIHKKQTSENGETTQDEVARFSRSFKVRRDQGSNSIVITSPTQGRSFPARA